MDFVSENDGWAVGYYGTILHFDGTNWQTGTAPTSSHLRDVSFLSANNGWVVGDDGTILHYDGASWTEVDNPHDHTITGVDFVDPYSGWACGLTSGKRAVILRYTDEVSVKSASLGVIKATFK